MNMMALRDLPLEQRIHLISEPWGSVLPIRRCLSSPMPGDEDSAGA